MLVEEVARRYAISLKKKGYQGIYGVGRVAGEETTILLPQTFMNLSGASVNAACQSLGVSPGDLIVAHDDLDLPFGRIRIRRTGGHGGHNGLRSLHEKLQDGEYIRVRVGVGRPPGRQDPADFVLEGMSNAAAEELEAQIPTAAQAVVHILEHGVESAMQEFNGE
jgi:PTH1 family peptidyl-tRNA hydrolase